MSKIKEIREKPSRIKNVKEKELDTSLENQVMKSSDKQFAEFVSSGELHTPLIESGQNIPQTDSPNEDNLHSLKMPQNINTSQERAYEPLVLSKFASQGGSQQSKNPRIPVIGGTTRLEEPGQRLGLTEGSRIISHAEEEKYSEKQIKSEDLGTKRKMPWEE